MGEAIIEVRNLSKKFGSFTAVDNTLRSIKENGFLGANGAGKTTAMKMLIGISTPTSGEAL
jgi:ABC-2 type transport system ATP-binding protein